MRRVLSTALLPVSFALTTEPDVLMLGNALRLASLEEQGDSVAFTPFDEFRSFLREMVCSRHL